MREKHLETETEAGITENFQGYATARMAVESGVAESQLLAI